MGKAQRKNYPEESRKKEQLRESILTSTKPQNAQLSHAGRIAKGQRGQKKEEHEKKDLKRAGAWMGRAGGKRTATGSSEGCIGGGNQ